MSISYKIHDFPAVAIQSQLFYVPGMAMEGGLTAGGVRMLSPEPGGSAVLETQISMRWEWTAPYASWLMSKTNGHIFRVPLARTPQLITSANMKVPSKVLGYSNPFYDTLVAGDLETTFTANALQGSNVVKIDMTKLDNILTLGHLIGHSDHCYMVDDIAYDVDLIATITVNPPLRKNVTAGDRALFRPFFLGTIGNGNEIRKLYEASNRGAIQLERILFNEVVL